MANAGPDTNGSQFFIISGPDGVRLPPQYSLFGKVVAGIDVVAAIDAWVELGMLTPDGRLLSVGNFDASGLAAALDYMRISLAQALTLSCERVQKLLSQWHTGLPTGLRERDDLSEDALSIFGHGAAALAAEARLLAQPVSFELPTSSIAESIEDRVTMAPLAARRLDEQASLALRLATVELLCAAQAIDLRDRSAALGVGTRALYTLVRVHVPPLRAGDSPVTDLDALLTAFEASLADVPDELDIPNDEECC